MTFGTKIKKKLKKKQERRRVLILQLETSSNAYGPDRARGPPNRRGVPRGPWYWAFSIFHRLAELVCTAASNASVVECRRGR